MQVKFRGAYTFENDDALSAGMQAATQSVADTASDFLTMDHIEPLGLHVTVHHDGNATEAQLDTARTILRTLARAAYSGYVDIEMGEESERFHAKEIAPKKLSVDDITTE